MSKNDSDDDQEGMVPVILPSGARFQVHQSEFQYFTDRARKYQEDNDFVNISDFQDVDRLLILELLCHRWSLWISQMRDFWGDAVDENTLQKALKDHSTEIRQLKKTLGLDRETREKVRGEDSVENYLAKLRQRAKHFGYKRNDEAAKAIELWKKLESMITLHVNCDEKERIEQHCTWDHIIRWLQEDAFPQYDAIDDEFRDGQRFWIRDM